jgi:NADH-quinone oxidoreductase subunit N
VIAVIHTTPVDWYALSPVLAGLGGAGVALLLSVLVRPRWRKVLAALAVSAGFITAIVFAVLVFQDSAAGHGIVADAVQRDRLAAFAQLIVFGSALVVVLVSWGERFGQQHAGEYFALVATAASGMAFFVSAENLMTMFLGLEWFSLSLYVLCAIAGDREPSLEAGLKYLIVGGFGSAILLFGSALVYGATGELEFGAIADVTRSQGLTDDPLLLVGLAMLLTGLGFKSSAAPFHMWTPDVYQGAPTPVTALMSAGTKTAAFVLTLRVLVTAFPELTEFWTVVVAVLVCASLAVGNLAALVQRNVKRLLAYSSISHAGFMLIAIAVDTDFGAEALLYYLIPYSAASIGAFAVVAARERELAGEVSLDDLAGMGWERPLLGVSLWAFMLSFAGLPLTGGFFGKFLVFSAAVKADWTWLAIVGVVATAVSLYYYLAVIRALYMRAELRIVPVGGSPPRELLLQIAVVVCLAVTVGSFFAVQPLTDWAADAAAALQF